MIYFKLCLSFLLIYSIGASFLSFYPIKDLKKEALLSLPIGYILLHLFYFEARKAEITSQDSIYLLLCLTLFFIFIACLYKGKRFAHIFIYTFHSIFTNKLYLPLLITIAVSTWQYYLIGETYYKHSSNEDFYDGIVGGHQFAILRFENILEGFKTNIRYQYSIIGFYETLFSSKGINAFLHNAILNIVLVVIGCYYLMRNIFEANNKIALFTAFFCFNSTFYFHTFLAGHIGSMIYTSIAPFYIGIILSTISNKSKLNYFFLLLLIYYFLNGTYPSAQLLIIGPAFVYYIFKIFIKFNLKNSFYKNGTISKLKASFLLFLIFLSLLTFAIFKWYDWETARQINYTASKTWKIISQKEIIPIFWGLFSPNIAGGQSLHVFLAEVFSIKTFVYFFSILLFTAYIYFPFKNYKNNKLLFLNLYSVLYPYMLLLVWICWGSTYYTYKVMYVNYFLVILIIAFGFNSISNKNKMIRFFKTLVLFIICSINIFWNTFLTTDIYQRPYHQKLDFEETINYLKVANIQDLQLLVPTEIDQLAITNTLNEHNIKCISKSNDSKFCITYSASKAIFNTNSFNYKTLFENNTFAILKKPDNFIINIEGFFIPQKFNDTYLYWTKNSEEINISAHQEIQSLIETFIKIIPNKKIFIDEPDENLYMTINNVLSKYSLKNNMWENNEYGIRIKPSTFNLLSPKPKSSLIFFEHLDETPILQSKNFLIYRKTSNILNLNAHTMAISQFVEKISKTNGTNYSFYLCNSISEKSKHIFQYVCSKNNIKITKSFDENNIYIDTLENINLKETFVIARSEFNAQVIVAYKPIKEIYKEFLKKVNISFKIKIEKLQNKKFLNMFFLNGPSIDYGDYTVSIYNDLDQNQIEYYVKENFKQVTIPLPENQEAITYYISINHAVPHSLLPRNESILATCLSHIFLSNDTLNPNSTQILSNLNQYHNYSGSHKTIDSFFKTIIKHITINKSNSRDIYDSAKCSLLGAWNPVEKDYEIFRWASSKNKIKITLPNCKKIIFDIEGADKNISTNIYFSINGKLLPEVFTIINREKITLKLPKNSIDLSPEISIFTDANHATEPLSNRKLYFKIFKIEPK